MTRTFDPTYPRILKRAQAGDARFYESLGALAVRGIEAIMNGTIEREPGVPALGDTGHYCLLCGAVTYGYALKCGKCGKERGGR